MTAAVRKRPKHLDLMKIRLPLPGIVSILHRISGALLFLLVIPCGLAALDASLASAEGYAGWGQTLSNPVVKLIAIGFAWAYLHHFCAGIRYLLLDIHQGIDLPAARQSSQIVLGVSLLLTLLMAVKLW